MVNRIADSTINTQFTGAVKTTNTATSVEQVASVSTHNNLNTSSKESSEQEYLPAEKAKKMTDSMNQFLETTNIELRFKFHDELKTYYVTLVDAKTDEVVREIPAKKLMDVYAAMRDFVGFFVDKKI